MQRIVEASQWLAKAALCLCLAWYIAEIVICLAHSSTYEWLSIPIGLLLVAVDGAIATKLIISTSSVVSAAFGLAVTALVTATVAIWIAITINPDYGFEYSPLLKTSFLLLKRSVWS